MGAVSAGAAVIALVAAGLLMWKKAWPKVAAVLLLVAGAGIAGAVGGWLRTAAGYVEGFVDQLVQAGFGAAVSGVITFVLLFVVIHDLWPKHKANRVTQGAAFALPIFGIAGNGIVASVLGAVVTALGSALLSFVDFI